MWVVPSCKESRNNKPIYGYMLLNLSPSPKYNYNSTVISSTPVYIIIFTHSTTPIISFPSDAPYSDFTHEEGSVYLPLGPSFQVHLCVYMYAVCSTCMYQPSWLPDWCILEVVTTLSPVQGQICVKR